VKTVKASFGLSLIQNLNEPQETLTSLLSAKSSAATAI
jgi:hypothetical protein